MRIRELSREEADGMLEAQPIGRLAYSYRDRVDIVPMALVYAEGWLWGRTVPGGKLDAIEHNRWVAYEVDESEDLLNWRSVVVHGTFYRIDGLEGEAAAVREEAVEILRRIAPWTETDEDPVPERTVYFRIYPQEVCGRAASCGSSRQTQNP